MLYKEPKLFKIVPWFIGFVFILIMSIWITLGVLTVKVVDEVEENGLKSIVEDVWYGKEKKDIMVDK